MLVKVKSVYRSVCRWLNQNASKRWLLLLDRITIFIFWLAWSADVATTFPADSVLTVFVFMLGAGLLFIVLYTPSYMFPNCDLPAFENETDEARVDFLVKRVQRLEEELLVQKKNKPD